MKVMISIYMERKRECIINASLTNIFKIIKFHPFIILPKSMKNQIIKLPYVI